MVCFLERQPSAFARPTAEHAGLFIFEGQIWPDRHISLRAAHQVVSHQGAG